METKLTLKPGQAGTHKLLAQYGEHLVRVRYRYDPKRRKRIKTAEIIVEEIDWQPVPGPEVIMHLKVNHAETELREKVKAAGGRWKPEIRRWTLPYKTVVKLGLQKRVTEVAAI